MAMARNWRGMNIQTKAHRAAGRAIVGVGMAVAVETKSVTHTVSGTLRRSVHSAPAGYPDGELDEGMAEKQDLLSIGLKVPGWNAGLTGPAVEVGSWLPYACVEWVGRNHPGVTQGLENVRGLRLEAIVKQAFREEGL